jgi:hypothetical protein
MSIPFTIFRRAIPLARLLSTLLLCWLPLLGWGQRSIPTAGVAITENFDGLASTSTSSAVPVGFGFVETGSNMNATYAADNGSANGGNTYSYGTTATGERAFGTLLSSNLAAMVGASFTNNTGATITQLSISYTGEEWRLGTAGRTDQLAFAYSTSATSLSIGTYVSVAALNFLTPNTTGAGAKDGNAAANRAAITGTITGLSIANGATFYIRWTDTDASGADDGLAIDDFSITATSAQNAPMLTPSAPDLAGFTTTQGTASASQSYTLAGSNLPANGSVRVALPAASGYEVSSDNTTFGQTASFTYAGTSLLTAPAAPTVYVRLAASTAAGTYSSVALTSTVFDNAGTATAIAATVMVSGSVQGLSVAPTVLAGFVTSAGTASVAKAYTLTGTNLTASVLVTAPSGYEVSQTSATAGFGASQTISVSNANVSRTIYVRLAASAATGTYGTTNSPLRVTNDGGTNLAASVAVDGEVTPPAPTLTAPSTLAAFNTLPNAPSAAQSYTLSGSYLTADVTAPAGFEVSQTSATAGFGFSQTVAPTNNSVSATIYVRLASTATAGPASGTVANTSPGATSRNVAVAGTVVGEPTTVPTILASAPTASTVTLTLSNNSGTNYLVVVRPFGTAAAAPTDGTTYMASAAYGAAATTGPGNFVVLAGSTATVSVAGLSNSTRYAADAYAYNVGTVAGFENYLATAGTTDFSTATGPLLTYKADGLRGTSATLPPNPPAANLTATAITRSAGVLGASTSDAFVSTGFPAGNVLDANKYLTFSYVAAPGYAVNLATVQLGLSRSGSGATSLELQASTDNAGFTNAISLGIVTTIPSVGSTQFTFTPPAGALQGIAVPLYFRLFFYGGTANTRLVDANNALAVIVNGSVVTSTPVPEINLAQGTASIASGTGSYAVAATVVGANTATPFDIQNLGNAVLNLTGTPVVAISGNTADFALTQPTAATVAAGASAPFTLAFAPTSAGAKSVTISIANDDSNENPYTFTVTGNGVLAPVLTSFTPVAGPVGTLVTLTGTDFTSATTVAFNGILASAVTFTSPTSLTATVPTGATTGLITVANAYGSSTNSTSFTVVATPTAGTLLVEDNFAYAAGEKLTDHGWTGYSGNAGTLATTVAGNLTQAQYPRGFDPTIAASFAGSSTVRLLGNTTSGQDVYRAFTPSTGTTTNTYAAALVSVNTADASESYFMSFLNTASDLVASPDLRGRVFIQKSGTGCKFGLSIGGALAGTNYTPIVYSLNTPYLLVLKYTVTGTTNTANLYVYPGAAEVAEPAAATLTASGTVNSSLGTLNALVLRQDDSDVNLDGVRVASGWGAAIGRPVYIDEVATLSAGNYYSLAVTGASTRVTTSGTAFLEGNLNLNGGKVTTSAADALTLRPGVTTQVDVSGASFVDGPLGRQARTASSLFFPIGRAAAYRPLTLNSSTAPTGDANGLTTFVASQTEGSPTDQTVPAPLTRISRVRYYSITPTPAVDAFLGTVELSFGADDGVSDPSLLSFIVAQSDGQGWTNLDRSANTTTSLTSGTFTGFSDFILASTASQLTANPLPVTLTSFGATRQASGTVQVAWATASEAHSAYFEVQRSLDGSTFATVAKVAAHGTTTQAHTYTSLDQAAPAAKLYYRLRQVDTDGKHYFSPVVTLATTKADASLTLYPNPAHTYLTVAAAAGEAVQVIDLAGRVLQATTLPASGQLSVEALPAGTYLLRVSLAGQPRVLRFTKE